MLEIEVLSVLDSEKKKIRFTCLLEDLGANKTYEFKHIYFTARNFRCIISLVKKAIDDNGVPMKMPGKWYYGEVDIKNVKNRNGNNYIRKFGKGHKIRHVVLHDHLLDENNEKILCLIENIRKYKYNLYDSEGNDLKIENCKLGIARPEKTGESILVGI